MPLLKSGISYNRIFRKKFMWILAFSLTSICSAAAIIIATADFKGEWTFNEQKSKLAEGRFRMNAQKIKVTQDGDALSIERTSTSQNGDNLVSTEKLTFDGKTSESTAFGSSKKKSTASWSADGQQMTINSTIVFERDGNSTEIKIVEVWKLITDGKSLSVDYTSTSARGTSSNTFVYDKN
ncbi:MAG: hypothetical protein ABIN89_17290 [Chitinophagaceae bacterium]